MNLVTRLTEEQNSAGIFTYLNEYDQNLENKKYVDIWLNDSGINSKDYKLHIDLGLISEDANQNNELDSEEDIYFGNGIIEEEEDTGLDGCFDEYENGKLRNFGRVVRIKAEFFKKGHKVEVIKDLKKKTKEQLQTYPDIILKEGDWEGYYPDGTLQ